MKGTLAVTGDPAADELLNTDPLALLIGMLLDQQVPMEWAFKAPFLLRERLAGLRGPNAASGSLHADKIAATDPVELEAVFKGPPALHRFPGAMAKRVQALCQYLVDEYGGDAGSVWASATTGEELYRGVRSLPGYGDQKAKIFTALLAKRFGFALPGWQEQVGAYADSTPRSAADVDSADALQRVRQQKRTEKAKAKDNSTGS
ncbi:MAG: HhH-GPD-type base excision DNA repair protein [Acidimicrobiales bacterium]